ncbi:MAG: MFS transporter [Verrucomicrobia bacterium]|nr:MFS transporter [Verrucomicrobiota bacterium]MBU1733883.1 MFS transporter [Verrucomicrobiota bacterium]MBU1856291.1 MFS transporter [Verrucomicrobiota bacterium]
MSSEALSSRQDIRLTEAQQTRGMRLAFMSQVAGVHQQLFIGASAICPLFIIKLGGSDLQAMLPASIIGLMILVQIPVSVLIKPAQGKRFLQTCWTLSALPVGVALLASLWIGARPLTVWIVLGSLFLSQLLSYAGSTFWYPLLHDVVPARQLGRFFGNLRAIWSLAYFGLSVLAGIFLGQDAAVWKFVVIFGVVTALQLVREPFVARIPVRSKTAMVANAWREDIAYILKHKDVLIFSGYFMLLMFLAGFLTQPLVLYMKHLGFSTRDNTLIYAASVLGSVLALVLAGRIMDRIGTRRVFFGVHVILSGLALLIALVGSLPMAYAKPCMTFLQIVAGAALAVAGLANTAQIFYMAPASTKTMFMSIMVVVSMMGCALSPFLAGLILDSSWRTLSVDVGPVTFGIYQGLFLGAGLGLLMAMSLLPFIKNVRAGSRLGDLI